MSDEQNRWQDALERLRALDAAWEDEPRRQAGLAACKEWMAAQEELPRLAALSRHLTPDMPRRQFWCVLVPVEREVARCKVTDIDILDTDIPPDAPPAAAPMPVTVVLDSIRSAFNVGGIFRTAESFGVTGITLCGYTPLPTQAQVARAALGTERNVPWQHVEGTRQAVAALKTDGVRCYALETVADAPDIGDTAWQFPCALLLGNERFGLDAETLAACDAIVRIPSFGRKNSLNVVSAFTLAAYEMRKSFSDQSTNKRRNT